MLIQDKIVITDASCFITLDKIDGMHLLQSLYKQVITTPEIAAEFGKRLPNWVDVTACRIVIYYIIMLKLWI